MRIAHIAPPWLPISPHNEGVTEKTIYHLVEEQVHMGHDVTLFAPADACTSAKQVSFIPRSLLTEGIPWQANLKSYYHLHKACDYIAKHAFDIVHTHVASSGDMYIFPLAALLHTPLVATLHNPLPFDRMSENWIGDTDEYLQEWAHHVPLVATSQSAHERMPYTAYRAGIVPDGIHFPEYHTQLVEQGDYFIWMGAFYYEKGAHLAIEAAKKAQVPLILIGTKEKQSREALQYFQHMIEPYIDQQQIRYVGARAGNEHLDLLWQARALLNPVQCEEIRNLNILEAMAVGCPTISLAKGVATEIIQHGQTGFLAQSVDEMVHYMARIDQIERVDVRNYGYRHFSSRVMAKSYLPIYHKIIDRKVFTSGESATVETGPLTEVIIGKSRNVLSA